MPCPHFNIKIVQRSNRQSAVAAAAYQSGEGLFSEYDQKRKYYSKQKEVVHSEILLPGNAPPGYADRQTLWNAVEAVETQWNAQLARRFVLALPRELSPEDRLQLMQEYCRSQFVSKGMIADFAIHDKGDGNPHGHVLLTMRPMDEHGKWLPKARKVYDLDENGERIRLLSGNWKSHKENTADWNERKYGEIWRHEWEVLQNQFLEKAGRTERVDLRSFERQGNPHAPLVHLGAAASAMERKGIATNLGNLNREIVAANQLYDSIRRVIKSLQSWLADITQKIKACSAPEHPEETNLAEVMIAYMDMRKAGRADWSAAGQKKAQINDLKQISAAVVYLRQNGISTVEKLGERLNQVSRQASELRSQMRVNSRRSTDIDAIINAVDTVKSLEPIYKKSKSGFKIFRERYAAEHAEELQKYNKARRLLKKFESELPIDRKKLRAEQSQLKKDNALLHTQLEAVQADLEELKQVRWCVRQVMPEALPVAQKPGQEERQSIVERLHSKPQQTAEREASRTTQKQKKQNMEH